MKTVPCAEVPARAGEAGLLSPMRRAAVHATWAPSVHNTQPWRLIVSASTLEVCADRSRQVPVFDPLGRQLLMSCGTAVLNARAALAAAGRGTVTHRFPDAGRPELVARLELAPTARDDLALADLDRVAEKRRTNRGPFVDQAVRAEVLAHLFAAAELEGADLLSVRTAGEREAVRLLTVEATNRQQADPGYRAELRAWTAGQDHLGDGLPTGAFAPPPLTSYGPAAGGGDPAGCLAPHPPHWGPEACLVLATDGDSPYDWVGAGEALQRVLLTAAAHGLAVGLVASVVEIPETRGALRRELGLRVHPQLVLRVGYAAPSAPTRRRRLVEVIVETP